MVVVVALLLTAGGAAVRVMTGTTDADTVAGEISLECNARIFNYVDRAGTHTPVSSGAFTPLVVTVGGDGEVESIDNIYDIDVGAAGTNASSMDVTCAVVNRSTKDVMILGLVDHLAPPLSPGAVAPGPNCGNGHNKLFSALYGGGSSLNFTLFEENFPRDFSACDDNLSRISLKIGVQALERI